MATPDEALRIWAAEKAGCTPEEIDTVEFGYRIECWSEVTHEYGVYATIVLTDETEIETTNTWDSVLEGIDEYVKADREMHDEHSGCHDYNDYGDW